ncbi:MAG: flagellar hook-length control protein FliK [Bryobacterales bacterium]|nr:flagellar hook-length control protein FliK [Bryobacterales bacterium]
MKIEGGSQNVGKSADKPAERPGAGKGFGQLLRQKKASLEETAAPQAQMPQGVFAQQPLIHAEETEGAAPVQPAVVEALAAEIETRLDVMGPGEVRIEFHSQVLGGVSVHLTRQGDELQVQFAAATPETRQVLEANADSLRAALERHGYPSSVRVEARPDGGGQRRRQQEREAEERE